MKDLTFGKAIVETIQCMKAVKKMRPLINKWKRDYLNGLHWITNDGLVFWSITIQKTGVENSFRVCMSMWGEDQHYYSFYIPCQGSSKDIVDQCLFFRKTDVNNGFLWRDMEAYLDNWIQDR